MKEKQGIDLYRKNPKQSRSEYSIELIFEAAAQILQQERAENFNTNAIAQVAGVSVGTLYQYFPNKNAILLAMAKRELEKTQAQIIQTLDAQSSESTQQFAQIVIRQLLQAFDGRQNMRKIVLEALIANGLFAELLKPVEEVMQHILARHQQTQSTALSPVPLYVMTQSIMGTIRVAVLTSSPYLHEPEFEQELVDLFMYFLNKGNL